MNLNIGKKEKKGLIFIPYENRFLNTIVFGKKASGKTNEVLFSFANQDLENKDVGATFIVNKGEIAYSLYTLAKYYKRKVTIIKPSININISNKFLWDREYNYDYINNNIIDYKKAIKNKEIVIIDMETLKYKEDGIKATAKLLLQLQIDMQETDLTLRTPHFLYIDDANMYLPYIDSFLIFGNNFNIGTTLFFQSRNQFKTKDFNYSSLVDNNVMNTILLTPIDVEDVSYFLKQFFEQTEPAFYNRGHLEIIYEIMDVTLRRKSGGCTFFSIDEELKKEIEEKSKNNRKRLLKNYKNELIDNKKSIGIKYYKDETISNKEMKEEVTTEIKKEEKDKKIKIMQSIFSKMSSQEFLDSDNLFK